MRIALAGVLAWALAASWTAGDCGHDAVDTARDADDARAIVEQAVAAHGGEKALARMKRLTLKGEGVYPPPRAGDLEFRFRFEDTFDGPTRMRRTIEIVSDEFPIKYVMVLDGDKGWLDVGGQVEELEGARLTELIEQCHAHYAHHLLHLLDKPYRLTRIEDIQQPGGRARGVKVEAKGRRDIRLYFDAKSGLLVKREHLSLSLLDGESRVELQEDYFSEFKDRDGLKFWTQMETRHGGKKTTQARLTEVKFPEKIDPRTFARP